jgi:uncharacterized protein (TIGR02145 family)
LEMRKLFRLLMFALIAILYCSCEKEKSAPNANWIPGGPWIDTRDGHQYATVPIGDQVWMAENMAYLPSVNKLQDGSEDEGHEDELFYYVNDFDAVNVAAAKETSYYKQYGVLYNWNAAKTACPDGWHLPSDEEWMELEINLGIGADEVNNYGSRGTDEGMKIKSTWGWDYEAWNDRYGNGTNETGFTGLPGGDRWFNNYISYLDTTYQFFKPGHYGFWWSSTTSAEGWAWMRSLSCSHDRIDRLEDDKHYGNSVRCIKSVD